MSFPNNEAAWLDGIGQPLRIGPAVMPTAGEGEIVIRNKAIAINPVSWKRQDFGVPPTKFPSILDHDVAGDVYDVGSGIVDFQIGDRVTAFLQGPFNQSPSYGAYQLFSVAKADTVAKLPAGTTYSEACVLPVAFNTAIVGLCGPPGLGLGLPGPKLRPTAAGKTIVIWGASSSIGLMMLQIAKAAGVQTIAIAGSHNFELCLSAGATSAFDYKDSAVIEQVVRAVKETNDKFIGVIDCISVPDQSVAQCLSILDGLGGGGLAVVVPGLGIKASNTVQLAQIFGRDHEFVLPFWEDFLPRALEQGVVRCIPEAFIAGHGLQALQDGLDNQRNGVSAKKVVVTL